MSDAMKKLQEKCGVAADGAFGVPRSHALMNTKSVRVQRLHTPSGLVAEVERALVLPLWLAGNATRKA